MKNHKLFCLKLHIDNDADVINVLEQQENKNGFLKKLIRNYEKPENWSTNND